MKKSIFIVLFFLVALVAKAQMPYEQYSNDGILLDFSKIENLDFRVYFMYNLQQDRQFSFVQDEDYGMYIITPADNDGTNFSDAFDAYYNEKLTDFSFISKTEIDEHLAEWKSGIASTDMTSIMMDWFLRQSRVDNDQCATSLPFCTSETITFEAANTSSTAHEPGMDDGCIGSSYNPSFYHMRIRVGGQFVIHMEGVDPHNPSIERDIDFCMWGPYTEEEVMSHSACSNLSSGKIIDCCYSAYYSEDCYLGYTDGEHHHNTSHGDINYHVPEVAEYYILMITNFSQQPCVISFSKVPDSGPGETDCGILPGVVTNDGPYCDGETIQLDVNEQPNGTYQWVGPDGWTSTLPHPIRENATVAMSGTYSCTTTVGAETTTASTEVIIGAIPEPTASAQPNSVNYGSTTQLSVDPGVQGSFTYHWEPEDLVADPNAQNTQTIALTSTQLFTVTVTNTIAGCTGTADVSVAVGSNLSATATADEYVICEGSSTTLHVNPMNGTGNYTFSWNHSDLLNSTTAQNPTATPPVGTTTFTCQVNDGMTTQSVDVTIHVNPNSEPTDIYEAICPGDTYYFYGEAVTTACDKNHMDYNQYGCDSLVRLHLTVYPDVDPTDIYDSICPGDTYYFYGEPITAPSYKEHVDFNQFGCDSLVRLHLAFHPTHEIDTIIHTCNEYLWNPKGKTYTNYTFNGQPFTDETISENGIYQRTYESINRCDSVVTINATFEYTPNPKDYILSPDPSIGEATHAVITASEFQINTYDFTIKEQGLSQWTEVVWTLTDQDGNEVDWLIETEGIGDLMHLTVFNYVPGRLTLTATATNDCGSKTVTHWLECTFYGIEEDESHVNVDIVPNPNNGQMTLNFGRFTGNVNVKVYNMSGELIDSFETYNEMGDSTLNYSMKQRSAGIYYFVVTGKEGTITKKVVVTQ